jgi:hypothetical protein
MMQTAGRRRQAGDIALGVGLVSVVLAFATNVSLLFAVSAVATAVFLYFVVPRPARDETPTLFEDDRHSEAK